MGNENLVARAADALDWLQPLILERFLREAAAVSDSEKQRSLAAGRILGVLSDVKGGLFEP
jgi:hypothetical protein